MYPDSGPTPPTEDEGFPENMGTSPVPHKTAQGGQEEEEEEEEEEKTTTTTTGEERSGKCEEEEEEEEDVSLACMEPSTLQWTEKKEEEEEEEEKDYEDEERTRSLESLGASHKEMDKKERLGKMDELGIEIEEGENCLPETAAAVFHPSVQIVHPGREEEEGDAGCGDSEKSPFLRPQGTLPDGYFPDWHEEDRHQTGGCTCCSRGCCCGYDALKAGAGLMSAGLLCPLLLWGGYALLPFDAPLLKDAPQRLVYTLHCATFATVPILLGVLVQGLCRLCPPSLTLRREDDKEPTLHQRFVNDSVGLFLLFFLNLAALSTYLSQEHLKLVPLLTSLFAMGRLVYWLAFALGSSFRSLGFGLTFFPIPAMLVANMYFMFVLEGSSIFALEPDPDAPGPTQAPSPGKQRFWG